MYKVFRNIPNTPWNALCEFIDNSIQAILDSNISGFHDIEIDISNDSIIIRDSGPGFSNDDLASGLEPARVPENRTQLNEFGMGMKLASLYFGDSYSIETSQGNSLESILTFDLDEVVEKE
jgi:anti-sigma regulatory factor (Ser/Thr protein kinase)